MDPTTPVAANGRDSPSVSPRTPPEGRLSVPPTVRGRRRPAAGPRGRSPRLSSGGDAVSEEYRVWLTESPNSVWRRDSWWAYDPTPVRVRVRKAEDEPPSRLPAAGSRVRNAGAWRGPEGRWRRAFTGSKVSPTGRRTGPSGFPTPEPPLRWPPPTGNPFALADEAARRGEWLPHRPLLLGSSFATRATRDPAGTDHEPGMVRRLAPRRGEPRLRAPSKWSVSGSAAGFGEPAALRQSGEERQRRGPVRAAGALGGARPLTGCRRFKILAGSASKNRTSSAHFWKSAGRTVPIFTMNQRVMKRRRSPETPCPPWNGRCLSSLESFAPSCFRSPRRTKQHEKTHSL